MLLFAIEMLAFSGASVADVPYAYGSLMTYDVTQQCCYDASYEAVCTPITTKTYTMMETFYMFKFIPLCSNPTGNFKAQYEFKSKSWNFSSNVIKNVPVEFKRLVDAFERRLWLLDAMKLKNQFFDHSNLQGAFNEFVSQQQTLLRFALEILKPLQIPGIDAISTSFNQEFVFSKIANPDTQRLTELQNSLILQLSVWASTNRVREILAWFLTQQIFLQTYTVQNNVPLAFEGLYSAVNSKALTNYNAIDFPAWMGAVKQPNGYVIFQSKLIDVQPVVRKVIIFTTPPLPALPARIPLSVVFAIADQEIVFKPANYLQFSTEGEQIAVTDNLNEQMNGQNGWVGINGVELYCENGDLHSGFDHLIWPFWEAISGFQFCPYLFNQIRCITENGTIAVPFEGVTTALAATGVQITFADVGYGVQQVLLPFCATQDTIYVEQTANSFTIRRYAFVRHFVQCPFAGTTQLGGTNGNILRIQSTAPQVSVQMPANNYSITFTPTGDDYLKLQGVFADLVVVYELRGGFTPSVSFQWSPGEETDKVVSANDNPAQTMQITQKKATTTTHLTQFSMLFVLVVGAGFLLLAAATQNGRGFWLIPNKK